MERIEFHDEVIRIAVAIGHSLESTDLVVDAFEWSCGNLEVIPVQNPRAMAFQRVGHGPQDPDARGPSSGASVCEEPASDRFVGLLPDLTEIFLEIVANHQGLIQSQCFHQSRPFIL
jgi:hypothetical protein